VVDTERKDGGRSTDSRGGLVIDVVSIDDEGRYYCSAYSPLDDLRTDYPIWVSVKGQSLSTRCSGNTGGHLYNARGSICRSVLRRRQSSWGSIQLGVYGDGKA